MKFQSIVSSIRFGLLAAAALAAGCSGEAPLGDPEETTADAPAEARHTAIILNYDGTPREVEYEIANGYAIIDGDVNIGLASDLAHQAKGFGYQNAIWPDRTVVYKWGTIADPQRGYAQQAMTDWTNATGIRFREAGSSDTAWTWLDSDPTRCHCAIGTSGDGVCGFASTCGQSAVRHEMGHAIGLKHEHQRCNRDDEIRYYSDRVQAGKTGNFAKICDSGYTTVGNIDFNSIMMYGSTTFAIDPALPPLVKRSDLSTWASNSTISAGDALTVRTLYKRFTTVRHGATPIISNSATRNRFCKDNGYSASESYTAGTLSASNPVAEYTSSGGWVTTVDITPPFANLQIVSVINCQP